ncbi:MAG: tRNA guanosine(34) transglycosylase Tgt [Bacteroidia bacterium]|nr:MAG: tRNA guanosine(34) transglycosylase Tgt [Bacteroidia bacterium]
MRFQLLGRDPGSNARSGLLHTPHGQVRTPIFMPVGTLGGVKAVLHESLRSHSSARIVLGNTYHLFLRPGLRVLRDAGGLHRFSTWSGPMLTDSGGFQVFSLSHRRRLSELGAQFRSHVDGTPRTFTPERVINIERIIGADIIMPLDECPPGDAPHAYASESLDLTLRWYARAHRQLARTAPLYGYEQALFPIVQGAAHLDLRSKSAEVLAAYDAPGYAIGGLAVGEPTEVMYSVLEHLHPLLPSDRPRYLMGVGTPANLLEAIARGVDMFDCVMPTRNARNGVLFTHEGILNMRNLKWRHDHGPLDPTAPPGPSRDYSRAYLRHLFVSNEQLAGQIASVHNLSFYLRLMEQAREHIAAGTFSQWKQQLLPKISRKL